MTLNGDDVRIQRTREKLRASILKLTRGGEAVTVRNVTIEAGVSRATFYRHTDSAEALMWSVLREELDEIRESALRGELSHSVERDIAFEHALGTVVTYVIERLAGLFATEPRRAAALFTEHLYESVTEYRRRSEVSLLAGLPVPSGIDPDLLEDAAASSFAHSFAGTLMVWLRERGDAGAEHFLAVFDTVAPRWWLSATSQSTGELESSRAGHLARQLGAPSGGEREESP